VTEKRRRYSAGFKFRIALEAAKGTRTLSEIASETAVHPNQISQWKRQLLDDGTELFRRASARQQREQEKLEADLYEQIGRLKMELEWLKKKAARFGGDQTRHD
jgi:transposase-like protein